MPKHASTSSPPEKQRPSVHDRMSISLMVHPFVSLPPNYFDEIIPSKGHRENLCSEPQSLSARRLFIRNISDNSRSTEKGHIVCRLCGLQLWGPNGRFHIERCRIISDARSFGRIFNAQLVSVGGIHVDSRVFKKGRRPTPKPAKIQGFVMSNSASLKNPRLSLFKDEIESGEARGKKGYVRCLKCNSEVFAPNSRFHATVCHGNHTITKSASKNANAST